MITSVKLKIYNKYSGNIDGWARVGKKSELSKMNDDDWILIDELLQSLALVDQGLASESLKAKTIEKLNSHCDSEKTKQELKSLIGNF